MPLLTPKQRKWLTKISAHPDRKRWLYDYELETILSVLNENEYTPLERTTLQEIVSYYSMHIGELGTLDNPV